jgi:Tfp pilus assembly protein PilV
MNATKNIRGISLVEIIIASSIISVTLLVLISVYTSVAKYSLNNVKTLKATQLTEEAVEVLKYLRDSGYTRNINTLNRGTKYRLFWDILVNSGTWTATTSPILLEERFDVNFVLSNVYRDNNFNVVASGGSIDASSTKATVNVSWRDSGATSTKTIETYLFNIFSN